MPNSSHPFLLHPVVPDHVEAFERELGCWSKSDRSLHARCGRHRVYLTIHGCPVALFAADLAGSLVVDALKHGAIAGEPVTAPTSVSDATPAGEQHFR